MTEDLSNNRRHFCAPLLHLLIDKSFNFQVHKNSPMTILRLLDNIWMALKTLKMLFRLKEKNVGSVHIVKDS